MIRPDWHERLRLTSMDLIDLLVYDAFFLPILSLAQGTKNGWITLMNAQHRSIPITWVLPQESANETRQLLSLWNRDLHCFMNVWPHRCQWIVSGARLLSYRPTAFFLPHRPARRPFRFCLIFRTPSYQSNLGKRFLYCTSYDWFSGLISYGFMILYYFHPPETTFGTIKWNSAWYAFLMSFKGLLENRTPRRHRSDKTSLFEWRLVDVASLSSIMHTC